MIGKSAQGETHIHTGRSVKGEGMSSKMGEVVPYGTLMTTSGGVAQVAANDTHKARCTTQLL